MPSVKEEKFTSSHLQWHPKYLYNKSFVLPVIKMIYTAE